MPFRTFEERFLARKDELDGTPGQPRKIRCARRGKADALLLPAERAASVCW